MSENNPITEAVRSLVASANQPAAATALPFVQLVAALSDDRTPVTDEALLMLPQEFRRLSLTAFTMVMAAGR